MTKRLLVVMGVSGCGKSTLANQLASHLKQPMIEADDHHSAEAKALMQAGTGLTEQHRAPWLTRVISACEQALTEADTVIVACSALKKSHRNRFRSVAAKVHFIWPEVPVAALQQRLKQRKNHFVSASLLSSQFAALEPPYSEPDCLRLTATTPLQEQLQQCLEALDAPLP